MGINKVNIKNSLVFQYISAAYYQLFYDDLGAKTEKEKRRARISIAFSIFENDCPEIIPILEQHAEIFI